MPESVPWTTEFKEEALAAGIDLIGVTSAAPLKVQGPDERDERMVDPADALPDARAVVVAGFNVGYSAQPRPSEPGAPRGRFPPYGSRIFRPMSAYCRKTIRALLKKRGFRTVPARGIPLKVAAVRAGLGRYGKNALIVTKGLGSWVMFECMVTDAPLEHEDRPLEDAGCRGCDLCLKACPTRALYAPYKVDRARCITDWLWGAFAPPELRELQGDRLFGCGECLMVCPRNGRVPERGGPVPLEDVSDNPELIPLATADAAYYRRTISSFPLQAGVDAIRGNVAIALGNSRDSAAVDALVALLGHSKPQIRAYAAWALGRIGGERARAALENALRAETGTKVVAEIRAALESCRN